MALRIGLPLRKNYAKLVFGDISPLQSIRFLSSSKSSVPKMRFVQFLRKNDDRRRLGVVSEDGSKLVELSGGACISNDMVSFISQNISMEEIQRKLNGLQTEEMTDSHILLPPLVNPQKIICIGLNFKDHCEEQNKPAPTEPMFFSKFNTALTGPTGDVIAHKITT
ncbi:PREDICTED: fumarylacetoacetate hydrolase domain-containing protein 2-like, partial [Rhagoletis zephyria]